MALASLKMVTLDSSDVRRDVAFWAEVLGWDVAHTEEEYGMLTSPDGLALGFGLVEGYEAPGWPNSNGSKQFHLDLAVDDLDGAAERVVALGGTLPQDQPGETWRVVLDPSGHPFCLTRAASWA
ncbi:VOC family protein [Phycicoccus flavus]|uniref:VOC family protein n=1 Tax=Phycicoccus flavus TaxID=2502783 RepID=UPI000FEB89B2|nr:VOC family protein [Phycicoccus flavus]NHA67873.1 VOC family protein [Phycicoccus flavus]